MKYTRKDIKIFERINTLIAEGKIVPYDDYLLEFLANHTNRRSSEIEDSNYLDTLCSTYSVGENQEFSRYLALGMKEPFKLCTGTFNAVSIANKQTWIETEEFVYDVSFIGKYPKKLYYELFAPINVETIDLNDDYDFRNIKNIETKQKKDTYYLKYFDWCQYMELVNDFDPFWGPIPVPELKDFPQFESKKENTEIKPDVIEKNNPIESDNPKIEPPKPIELDSTEPELHKHIKTEWARWTARTDIPSELFSPLLEAWIKDNIPLYLSNYPEYTIETIYSGLIKFIVRERFLYEDKKYDLNDLTLWKKAMAEYSKNYSCLVGEAISIIPFILELKIEQCVKNHTPSSSPRYNEFKKQYGYYNSYQIKPQSR